MFFLFAQNILSQEIPRVINYSTESYKAHHQNWGIAQAQNDFIYFANTSGLLEYNGTSWKNYKLPNQQIIRAIAIDSLGRIFTGAYGTFGYWQKNFNGQLTYHSLIEQVPSGRAEKEEIWHILLLNGKVLFQSFTAIYLYDYHTIKPLDIQDDVMFAHRVDKRLLVQGLGTAWYEIEKTGTLKEMEGGHFLSDKKIVFAMPFDNSSILVGTEGHGIFIYKKSKFTPWNNKLQTALFDSQLNKGIQLNDKSFAFGTIQNGLFIVDSTGKIVLHLNKESGLQDNTILSLFEDAHNNLWIGLDRGISFIEMNSPLSSYFSESSHLGVVYCAAFFENQFYLGTNHGLFTRLQNEDFHLIDGTQGQVWDLKVINSQLWCGHNNGTFIVDGKQVKMVSEVNGGRSLVRVPQNDSLLFQGTYSGIIRYKFFKNKGWWFDGFVEGFSESTRQIIFDGHNSLWAVHPYKGLYKLELDTHFKRIIQVKSFSSTEGIPSEFNVRLTYWKNKILAKSENDFFVFNHKTQSFTASNINNGDAPISNIVSFPNGDWFTIYPEHLVYHSTEDSTRLNLSMIPDYEKIIMVDSNRYLFCLDNGYAILDKVQLDAKEDKSYPPPKIISIEFLGGNKNKIQIYEDTHDVKFVECHLRFSFTQAVFHTNPTFSTMLKGYEKQWSKWSTSTMKEYTNLPQGKYSFMVKGLNTDEVSSFEFTVLPHWYETALAQVLSLIGIIGLFYLFRLYHLNRLEKQRKKLDIERLRQLEEEKIKAANDKLQLDISHKRQELANSAITLVQKNETLSQIKERLLDIKKKSSDTKGLSKDFQSLFHLIDVHISTSEDWVLFETNFNEIHNDFFKRLTNEYPQLSPSDLTLAAYLRMNLSSKEIAPLLNITLRGLENKRYYLRKKLNLPTKQNLSLFLINY